MANQRVRSILEGRDILFIDTGDGYALAVSVIGNIALSQLVTTGANSGDTLVISPLGVPVWSVPESRYISLNQQTGTTYQLVLTDGAGNVVVECANANPITLTVPTNAVVPFPIGTVIGIRQTGAGLLTVAGAGGVTINSLGSALSMSGQYANAALEKVDTDTWILFGSIA